MMSIWVILIDTSGSMGAGFSGRSEGDSDPLGESGPWATKLDAAKELLLRQVSSVRAQDIAVFRFTKTYDKIFHGSRDELLKNSGLINAFTAGGGTSIAAALDGVRKDTELEQYRSLSVLVLTDGLSDIRAASVAASVLVEKYPFARIDTILIDETDKGRAVAENISINGSVRTATSSIKLKKAISEARAASLRSELSDMAQLRFQVQRELSSYGLLAPPTLLTVTSNQSLAAATLRDDLSSTIAGIESIGHAVSCATQTEYRGSVSSISQDSPVSINLTGLADAVKLVLDYVIPWRRDNAERLATLDLQKSRLEARRQECELGFQVEKHRIEILRAQLELAESRWELVEKMLGAIGPELHDEIRERVTEHLLSGIDHLSYTRLEFKVFGDVHEVKRDQHDTSLVP